MLNVLAEYLPRRIKFSPVYATTNNVDESHLEWAIATPRRGRVYDVLEAMTSDGCLLGRYLKPKSNVPNNGVDYRLIRFDPFCDLDKDSRGVILPFKPTRNMILRAY